MKPGVHHSYMTEGQIRSARFNGLSLAAVFAFIGMLLLVAALAPLVKGESPDVSMQPILILMLIFAVAVFCGWRGYVNHKRLVRKRSN